MKTIIAAAVLAASGTTVSAADLGYGISIGGETTAEYNVDTQIATVAVEPTLGYYVSAADVQLEASTLLSVYNDGFVDSTFDTLPTVDFRAEKGLFSTAVVYGEISYDLSAEKRSDAVVGVSFTF